MKASGDARWLGPDDALNLAPAPVLLIDRTFGHQDLIVRERAAVALDRLRRAGATALVVSHEEELIRRLCDEVWWLRQGKLAGRGDPEAMIAAYRKHVAARLRAWGETITPPVAPTMRRGDGRAEIVRVETVGESGKPTMVWRTGERSVVKVAVRFRDAVPDPVVGIMIRTRIGLNVYGTNTELEQLKLGSGRGGRRFGTGLRLLVRALPRRVHADRRVPRPRRRLARLAGGRRRLQRQRHPLHRGSGQPPRPGKPSRADLS